MLIVVIIPPKARFEHDLVSFRKFAQAQPELISRIRIGLTVYVTNGQLKTRCQGDAWAQPEVIFNFSLMDIAVALQVVEVEQALGALALDVVRVEARERFDHRRTGAPRASVTRSSAAAGAPSTRPDLDFLEYAYDLIFRRFPVDFERLGLIGYSDGASYGLSVGLSNPELFRAVMGWAAGLTVRASIERYDHWIAFGLLAFVGVNMIREAFKMEEDARQKHDPTRGLTLVMLSVATSIDALAVGLTISMLQVSIWFQALVMWPSIRRKN